MNPHEQIEQAAALWVVRLERGLTAAEQDEFIDWLTADPRHAKELDLQKQGWDRLDLIADWRPEHCATANRDLLAPRSTPARRRHYFRPALGLAAVLVLGLFLLPRLRSIDPVAVAPTPIALIEERRLEDGTVVSINRGARLSVHYNEMERRIELSQGEAHFQVAHNPARPFIVAANGIAVRAIGTAFNVRLDDAGVEVLVTEGRVGVQNVTSSTEADHADDAIQLSAGQRAVVGLRTSSSPQVEELSPASIAEVLAWQPRLLEFDHAPLAEIVRELNRRNAPIRITIADRQLDQQPLNASIRSDNIEGFVRLLEGGFRVQVDRAGEVITLRTAAPR